jgi:transcription elongation GreA/GreB family factor
LSKLIDAASAGDLDKTLEIWLELLEEDPPYADMMHAIEILLSADCLDTARELVEATIEEKELAGGKGFDEFLLHSSELLHGCEPLRKALVEYLRDQHLMFQPLEHFLQLSGLKRRNADVSAAWAEFQRLMMYTDGGYLYHSTFGTGRIVRVSRTHITADFRTTSNHDMELDVALETTCPLNPDSLAVLAMEDGNAFMELLESSPGQFLERLLQEPFIEDGGIADNSVSPLASGIEMDVSELWKLLKKAAGSADGFGDVGRRIVELDENVELIEQIRRMITARRISVSEKVKQIKALIGSYSGPVTNDTAVLLDDVYSIDGPETGALFELCWILSSRSSAEDSGKACNRFVEDSAARAERALAEIHSQSCRKSYLELFLSGDTDPEEKITLLSSLRRSLWEHAVDYLDRIDPDLLSRCISIYLSNPSQTDLFLWSLVYLAKSQRDLQAEPEDSGVELFLDNLVFASADTQKKVIGLLMGPLREDLNEYLDSIDTRKLTRYLESFDTSATAHNEGLFLAVGREMSRRKSSGMRRAGSRHFWETDSLFSSRRAIREREEEIQRLRQIDIPAAAEAIGEAASHGDLSENAEYAAAIEKRDLLLEKYNRWQEEIQRYRPYPNADISEDVVSPGTRVTLQDTGESEEVRVLEIVGPLDAEPEKGRINYLSPMGRSILGLSVGDTTVMPGADEREWRVALLEVLDIVEQ